MSKPYTKNLTVSAMLLAVGFVLPMLTGQVPLIGKALLPMHIPIFLCAFLCGWRYAAAIGLVLPLARSLLFSVPVLYPTAIAVALELAAYGIVAGLFYARMPKKSIGYIYLSMLPAMLIGRAVRCVAEILLLGLQGNSFVWKSFFAGTVLGAAPGIAIQLLFIPALTILLQRIGHSTRHT